MLVLTPQLLLSAYAIGLFPMANDRNDPTIHWIEPRLRGLLPLDRFHVGRSLKKKLKRLPFEIRVDTSFPAVIRACAQATSGRPRTWLNDELIRVYCELARQGHAHSVECWQDGRLVGGLYGVSLGAAFFGESMFSRVADASKVALVELTARLRHAGYLLLDTQFVTDHLQGFGAIEVPRHEYRDLLRRAIGLEVVFPAGPQLFCGALVAPAAGGGDGKGSGGDTASSQSITQTS
jgi:leucyl/phenylalanyl-tRNA--protein transferase